LRLSKRVKMSPILLEGPRRQAEAMVLLPIVLLLDRPRSKVEAMALLSIPLLLDSPRS
jgi:hypothetical protein